MDCERRLSGNYVDRKAFMRGLRRLHLLRSPETLVGHGMRRACELFSSQTVREIALLASYMKLQQSCSIGLLGLVISKLPPPPSCHISSSYFRFYDYRAVFLSSDAYDFSVSTIALSSSGRKREDVDFIPWALEQDGTNASEEPGDIDRVLASAFLHAFLSSRPFQYYKTSLLVAHEKQT